MCQVLHRKEDQPYIGPYQGCWPFESNNAKDSSRTDCDQKKGHSEDSLSLKLTEAWVSACLPLSAHRNAKLKKVLEEGFRRPLPSADTLANKYADWAYETKFDKLKQIAREFENFHVMFDETSDAGNKYYSTFIGSLDGNAVNPPFVIEIKRMTTSPNASAVQQCIVRQLNLAWLIKLIPFGFSLQTALVTMLPPITTYVPCTLDWNLSHVRPICKHCLVAQFRLNLKM